MKIKKSEIQRLHQTNLQSGMDDWESRTNIINSILEYEDPENENFVELLRPEHYFIVQSIWNLCDS